MPDKSFTVQKLAAAAVIIAGMLLQFEYTHYGGPWRALCAVVFVLIGIGRLIYLDFKEPRK